MSDYTLDDLLHEKDWRRVAPPWDSGPEKLLEGFTFFCEKYWYIRHPERGRIKFDLFEAQTETIDSWLRNRYNLILKARQIGLSTLVATFSFWLSYFYPDRPVIMLSRTERDAIKLLSKAKYGFRFLPEWMKWRGPVVQSTQTKMEFSNGGYIESLPSASEPARGESVFLLIVDEFAFLPDPEGAWSSIEPVVDLGGRAIVLSTANGYGNLFHEFWVGSQNGTNRWKALFHPWSSGDRSEDWYAAKKADLPEWQMAQEYPNDPEEAFLKSGRPVFELEGLRKIEVLPPITRGFLEGDRAPELVEDGGPLRIWAYPHVAGKYVIGADVAYGLEFGDFSSAHVIEAKTKRVVAAWHGHIDPDLFGGVVLARLGRYYNQALIGVENNNHGLTTLKFLQQAQYRPIYYQHNMKTRIANGSEILGWRTSQATKPLAIDELRSSLRGGLELLDEETIAELLTYVRDDDGKMHGSPWDDRVISLAIAVQMLKYVWLHEFQAPTLPPPGTFGYMERKMLGALDKELRAREDARVPPPVIGKQYARHQS